jgi:Protein of unknown function (DUF669)
MSDFELDLTGYRDKVGQRVPPGRYRVTVEDAELDTASSGNQMVNLWLRVMTGQQSSSVIVDRLVLTPKSLFRIVGFMAAIGLPTPRRKMRLNTRLFVGRVLDIDVEDGEPYMGRVKSEVRGYLAVEGAAHGEEEQRDLDDIAQSEEVPDDLSGLEEFTQDRSTPEKAAAIVKEQQAAATPAAASNGSSTPSGATPVKTEVDPAPSQLRQQPITVPDDIDLADLDL